MRRCWPLQIHWLETSIEVRNWVSVQHGPVEEQKVIFRTERLNSSSLESWGSVTHITSGPVHLASPAESDAKRPESTFTGYMIDTVSSCTRKRWKVVTEFTRTVYWFPASKPAYIGGFAAEVAGGLVGGR